MADDRQFVVTVPTSLQLKLSDRIRGWFKVKFPKEQKPTDERIMTAYAVELLEEQFEEWYENDEVEELVGFYTGKPKIEEMTDE